MRNFPDDASLDASITEGYEVIGTDGDGQFEASSSSYDRPASETGDDVQSLADTDTGTDAYTNDIDTDSSDDVDDEDEDDDDDEDEEEVDLDYTVEPRDESAVQSDDEDEHEVNMTMVERSLEHPTELSTPASAHENHSELLKLDKSWQNMSAKETYEHTINYIKIQLGRRDMQERLIRYVLLLLLVPAGIFVGQSMRSYTSPQTGILTTVPVASVSYITTPTATELQTPLSTVASTAISTNDPSHALQTTASSKGVASISPGSSPHIRRNLCSAAVHGRNEVLLKVPQQPKASWLAKHAVMISVSRGAHDVPSDATKITAVEDGFIIEIPQEEAYGVLDVSIATTRKPQIKESFRVNFGSFIIVDALDASKQLVKGFAQSIVDTLNGTTAWVEETCSPAFDLMSKPASVTDTILQGFHEATHAALNLRGHLADFARQPFPKNRAEQARKELLRTARDLQDEASLFLLQAQLNSRLQWLRWSGQTAEYEDYLAAAGPYFERQQADVTTAIRARADQTKKEIRAVQKRERLDRSEVKRSIWQLGGGGH